MSLRIALLGQAPLALDCLDRLRAAGHEIVAVFALPDAGRPDPLAQRARELGLHTIQRRYFQKADGTPIAAALAEYASLNVELNVLASMTSFVPSAITDRPAHRSICFHPSLLPRFRGGNALQWQILLDEHESGVTIFAPDHGVDTGPILVQRGGVSIEPHDTAGSLFFKKLAPLGAEALSEAVARIDKGEARAHAQDERHATFQGLVDERTAALDFQRRAVDVERWVRGCDPQPGAWAMLREQRVRLHDARLGPELPGAAPGEIHSISGEGMMIALRGGSMQIARVRADAGKESAHAFAQRTGLHAGERFTSP